jgi:hypothetical protein
MPNPYPGIIAASKAGWAKSRGTWFRLIAEALERRGITAHTVYIERVLKKTFTNNSIEGGNIGWSTIDSYVGYLQASDELGTPIKSHAIKFHRDRLNWAPRHGGIKKRLRPENVWGGDRESSTMGTRIIRSRW